MAGAILTDDNFTGLASDATIAGRVPPVSNTGASYVVDPNNAGVTGDGVGNVKFSTAGATAKVRCGVNGAVQSRTILNGSTEDYMLFLRDSANTPYPRWGYLLRFWPRFSGSDGKFTVFSMNNFTSAVIAPHQDVVWTFDPSGIDIVSFEGINNDFRVIINNVLAASFTNSLYPATDSTASKVGIVYNSTGASVSRLDRLTFYDSIIVTASLGFPIVRFS